MQDGQSETGRKLPVDARRDFLKAAALAAGAGIAAGALSGCASGGSSKSPLAGTNSAKPLGRGKAPNPPKDGETIRLAVVGTGGMGRGHCGALMAFNRDGKEDVEIVAVCDVNDLHAQAAVKQITDAGQKTPPRTYRDYRELYANEDIHGVVIATPEHQHAPAAIDAVVLGIDVYCEKPMTLRLEEAMAVRETANANPDVMFVVGTQKMMLPKYREAKKLIQAGAIGTPVFSQTSYCRNSPDGEWNYYALDDRWEPGVNLDWDAWLGHMPKREWDPKVYIRWRRYRDFSTGIIGDLLVHEITPLIFALDSVGWPKRVVATGGHYVDKEMENHDLVNLNIAWENDHSMIVAGATCNEVGLENLIRGHEANIYLNSRHCELRPTRPFVDEIDPVRIECPDIGNDQDVMRMTWLNAIRDRKQPDSTVDFATKVMVVVDLATRSLWDGHAYEFDRETMRVTRV
ncbi:MAG: Gfo/Idh/MocA family oxidoreductase [Planctomycetota bacterium]